MNLALLLALSPTTLGASSVPAPSKSDWPQFRGPLGTGAVAAGDVPLEWSETKNLAWKAKLAGQGWSQPIVIGDTIYLTEACGEGLERPMGMAAGVADPRTMKAGTPPAATIEWRVVALDLATGKERWSATAARAKPQYPIHPSNTWATETPVADANGVYAFFGATGTLAAFDPAGKPRWKVELGAHPVAQGYGTASSPALHDGKVYVQCFNEDAAFLVCLAAKDGKELWRVERESAATSWASPLVWHNSKRVELVASGGRRITSHDPATGAELWRIDGIDGPSSSSFGADTERLYFGQRSPFANPPLYALPAGGTGDLSAAKGSTEIKTQVWAQKNAAANMASPVVADGLLYVVNETLLSCRDAESGEELYKERVPGLVTVAASPIVVGDKLLLLDEEGRTALVRIGPDFEVVGGGKLEGTFWATPVVAGGALLLRGVETLYCVRR